jgi:hypothetical protein
MTLRFCTRSAKLLTETICIVPPRGHSARSPILLTSLRFIQYQLLRPLSSFIPQLCRQTFPLRQQILNVLLPLIDSSFLRLLRFLKDVFPPLAGLPAKLRY